MKNIIGIFVLFIAVIATVCYAQEEITGKELEERIRKELEERIRKELEERIRKELEEKIVQGKSSIVAELARLTSEVDRLNRKLHEIPAHGKVFKYDSGWFAAEILKTYEKKHNLGAIPTIIQLWYSDTADGSGECVLVGAANIYGTNTAIIVDVDERTIKVRAESYLSSHFNAQGKRKYPSNGYLRLTAILVVEDVRQIERKDFEEDDRAQQWSKSLWRECWNGRYVDFTTDNWARLSLTQQKHLSTAYQEWYAKKVGKPLEKDFQIGSTNIAMTLIPPGKFWMGSSVSEEGRDTDEIRHEVVITKPFYLSKSEVTQGQYQSVLGNNPSYFKKVGENAPVERVSTLDCQSFCEKTGLTLPTEAQWEYACRAGTLQSRYSNDLDNIAWYIGNSSSRTHNVAGKAPNAWGVFDMLGNVWELCRDRYEVYNTVNQQVNPSIPYHSESSLISRGGGWNRDPRDCRAANRYSVLPNERSEQTGFRVMSPIHLATETNNKRWVKSIKENGALKNHGREYYAEQKWVKKHSSVALAKDLHGDFSITFSWGHAYTSTAVVYSPDVSHKHINGYSKDPHGPYVGHTLDTSGFPKEYKAGYKSIHTVAQGKTDVVWMRWTRRKEKVTFELSFDGVDKGWQQITSFDVPLGDKVVICVGEAGGEEKTPLKLIKCDF